MENIIKQLDKYVEESLFYYDLPGLAVSVVMGENSPGRCKGLNYTHAVGYKDFITKAPLKADQIFHMGSVSKLFTATAIMQLCQQGKLKLENKLAEILPYVSIDDKRYAEIQVRHMLTHTSGLADVEDYHWDTPRLDEGALKDYAVSDEVRKSKFLWSPLENKFCYSNMAYELLGLIIAEISGMTYEAYMQRHFFQPLGMKASTFLTFERSGGSLKREDLMETNMAMPHGKDQDKRIVLEEHYPYNRQHGPSSTLTSNMGDLAKWGRAHLDRAIFPEKVYDEIWTSYTTVPNNGEGMGLGWFMRKQEGYDLYGHEGTDDGFRASFWICPELDAQIIVAANITKGPVKRINKKLFEMVL